VSASLIPHGHGRVARHQSLTSAVAATVGAAHGVGDWSVMSRN